MSEVLEIVAPLFGLILAGNLVARLSAFPVTSVTWLVRYVWYLAMPVAVFTATLNNPLPDAGDARMLIAYFLPLAICFLLAIQIGKRAFGQVANVRGVYGYSACFGNIIYMGLPVVQLAFGDEGFATLVLIISIHELFLITLTMIVRRGDSGNPGQVVAQAVGETLRVPLVLAILAGFLGASQGWALSGLARDAADLIGPTAAPIGLFAVGAVLARVSIGGDIAQATVVTGLKMILLPLLVWASAAMMDIDSATTAVMVIVASLPTGLNAFNMAQKYGAAPRRVATTILLGTALTIVALPALLWYVTGATG